MLGFGTSSGTPRGPIPLVGKPRGMRLAWQTMVALCLLAHFCGATGESDNAAVNVAERSALTADGTIASNTKCTDAEAIAVLKRATQRTGKQAVLLEKELREMMDQPAAKPMQKTGAKNIERKKKKKKRRRKGTKKRKKVKGKRSRRGRRRRGKKRGLFKLGRRARAGGLKLNKLFAKSRVRRQQRAVRNGSVAELKHRKERNFLRNYLVQTPSSFPRDLICLKKWQASGASKRLIRREMSKRMQNWLIRVSPDAPFFPPISLKGLLPKIHYSTSGEIKPAYIGKDEVEQDKKLVSVIKKTVRCNRKSCNVFRKRSKAKHVSTTASLRLQRHDFKTHGCCFVQSVHEQKNDFVMSVAITKELVCGKGNQDLSKAMSKESGKAGACQVRRSTSANAIKHNAGFGQADCCKAEWENPAVANSTNFTCKVNKVCALKRKGLGLANNKMGMKVNSEHQQLASSALKEMKKAIKDPTFQLLCMMG